MRNYFNYFTEIEDYFCRKRERNLNVAPLDWCLIELWRDNGIPLHIVLRGIDQSFESAQKRGKRNPTTLFYCHPAVMEAFEQYREAMVGSDDEAPTPELSREEILAYLTQLESLLIPFEEVFQRAREQLEALRHEAAAGKRVDAQQIDSDLNRIGELVVEKLRERLSASDLEALEEEIEEETKLYRKRLSKELYHKLKDGYRRRRIREQHGLPEFSLFAAP